MADDREKRLREARRRAAGCTACPLYRRATQTVFGEGGVRARLMLVGEQPGDEEDLSGRPFVGPAGRLLDRALERAGLTRAELYVTNVVKHFKWKATEGGKRRIHDRPRADEVEACRPWFQEELRLVQPEVVLCLGATAAAEILGRRVRIGAERGRALPSALDATLVITAHPSAVLRMPEREDRERAFEELVSDLRSAARLAQRRPASSHPPVPEP